MLVKTRIIIILLLVPYILLAQEVTYRYTRYGAEDGLLSTEIYCAIEDQKGYIWFGTDVGFSKFNGYEFINYTIEEGLTNNVIFNLYEDIKGRIWYMSFIGGIGFIENGNIESYPFNEKVLFLAKEKGWVSQIYMDKNETLHFIHSDGDYSAIDKKGNILPDNFMDGRNIIPLLGIENSIRLEFTKRSIQGAEDGARLRAIIGEKLIKEIIIPGFKMYSAIGLLPINETETFVILKGNHVIYLNESDIKVKESTRNISTISIDESRRVWVGYLNSGIEIYASIEAYFNNAPYLIKMFKGFNVSDILNIKNGGVFLSVENQGVYYIHNPKIENFDFGKRLRDNVTAICKTNTDEVVYSFESGEIYQITNLKTNSKQIGFIKDATNIKMINGDLYISSFNAGKKSVISSKKPFFRSIKGRDFDFIDKGVFVRSHAFVADIEKNNQLTYAVPGKHFFRSIYVENKNMIWLGGNEGLSMIKNGKWFDVNYLLSSEKKNVVVKSVAQLTDQTLIVTTSVNGIYFLRRKNGTFERYKIEIKNAVLENCKIDEKGKVIWVASNRGIYKIRYSDHFIKESIFRITENHGLASNEVNVIELVGEYVYAATKNGLSRFKKSELEKKYEPPRFYLTSFQVSGNEQLIKGGNRFRYSRNHIQFSFGALCYNCSGKVSYKCKLEGSEEGWHYTQARAIRYPALSPGEYRFLVSSANEDGIWGKPKVVSFSIIRPFWKTLTFFILLLAIIAFVIYIWYLRKVRSKIIQVNRIRHLEQQKRQVVQAKLTALRAQMNPHFTFNTLNGIQNAMLNSSIAEATNYISKFSVLLRKILEGSEKLKNTISEELEMLKLYMELENLRFSNTIQFEINLDSSLNPEFAEIPTMVIQPFVENAIVHGLSGKKGGAKRLEISLKEKEAELICIVKDNGIGRKRAEEIKLKNGFTHTSLGIKIANERLELLKSREIGEDFFTKIIDEYDDNGDAIGTTVKIRFTKD